MTHEQDYVGNEQLRRISEGVAEIKRLAGVELDLPGERRADSELPAGLDLDDQTETTIRTIAAEKLGIGLAEDITLEQSGLNPDGVVIVEGGQSHKMLAELTVALAGGHTGPIVMSSTEHRKIKLTADDEKVRERANTAALLGISEEEVGNTELAVALQVVESLPGFVISATEDASEGLVCVGTINGRQVFMYSIPREYYQDETGAKKYSQPSVIEQVQYITEATQAPEAALVTSLTYYSSRAVASDGKYRVAAYSPNTLAKVRGLEPSSAQPTMAQIFAEVAKTDSKLSKQ